ncbi:uncharacterized protein LOC144866377 [Branchiostoma floridae x Branchiostoma japonicum]
MSPFDWYANIPANHAAIEIVGDGNCLFNAVSTLLTGSDDHAAVLRLGATIYGAIHAEHIVDQYISAGVDNVGAAEMLMGTVSTDAVVASCTATDTRGILRHTIQEEARSTAKLGAFSGILQLSFLSGFCGYALTLYCEEKAMLGYNNQTMAPCGCDEQENVMKGELKLMLVRTSTRSLNHFVGLVKSSGRITRQETAKPEGTSAAAHLPGMEAAEKCAATLTLGCAYEEGAMTGARKEGAMTDMIQCMSCQSWYHFKCVPIPAPNKWKTLEFHCCARNRTLVFETVPNITLLKNLTFEQNSRWKVNVTLADVVSLRPNYWVTSGIVDFYGRQLSYGMSERVQTNIQIFESTFTQELKRGRYAAQGHAMEGLQFMLIPVCSQNHWKVLCVHVAVSNNPKRSQLLVLDSLGHGKANGDDVTAIKRYLSGASGQECDELQITSVKVPLQRNGSDCGAHTIYNMAWIVDNYKEFAVTRTIPDRPQKDVGLHMRKKIRNDLYHCMDLNMAEPTSSC